MEDNPYTVKLDSYESCLIGMPERSEWKCCMFGDGLVFTPEKGKEPNWFWRWTQFICFGHKWIKENN